MKCTVSASIRIEHAKYMQENNLSPSKVLQEAIDELMKRDGNEKKIEQDQ